MRMGWRQAFGAVALRCTLCEVWCVLSHWDILNQHTHANVVFARCICRSPHTRGVWRPLVCRSCGNRGVAARCLSSLRFTLPAGRFFWLLFLFAVAWHDAACRGHTTAQLNGDISMPALDRLTAVLLSVVPRHAYQERFLLFFLWLSCNSVVWFGMVCSVLVGHGGQQSVSYRFVWRFIRRRRGFLALQAPWASTTRASLASLRRLAVCFVMAAQRGRQRRRVSAFISVACLGACTSRGDRVPRKRRASWPAFAACCRDERFDGIC